MNRLRKSAKALPGVAVAIPADWPEVMIKFGDWVRIHRLALGWGQEELARRLGQKQAWMSRLETGRSIPNVVEVEKIGRILGDVEGAFKAAREEVVMTVQEELETYYDRRPLNDDELELLEIYRRLQARDKRRAIAILGALGLPNSNTLTDIEESDN